MKNIVKNIVAVLAFSVTAFTPGISAFAQNLPEGVYLESNGLAYRKTATLKPGTTDKYIIDLEAFVTGDVTTKITSTPADIVLVLDVSGSMNDPMYSENKTWTVSEIGSGTHYWSYNNDLYEVVIYNNRFYVYINGNWYTLSNSSSYSGTLYFGEKRIDALKDAVKKFIGVIKDNDL